MSGALVDIDKAFPNWKFQRRAHPPHEEDGRFDNPFEKMPGGASLGRRHFPPQMSKSYEPKRILKEGFPAQAAEVKPEGTRKVPQPDRNKVI